MRLSVGIPLLACAACGFQGHGKPSDDGGLDTSTSDTLVVDSPDAHVGPADWWNPAWSFRRRITVDNTGLVENLTGFPVPIRLADTTHLAAIGADVRFVSDFGVELPYDTDELDAGDASFWVQLTIPADPAPKPAFWMYYGNALAPVGETPTVFADYLAVYHLTTTSDATGKGHTLVPAIPMTPVVGGVGKVTQFDGTQVLTVPTESDFDFTTQMSASVWFRTAGFSGDWQALVTKGDNAWRLHRGGGSQHLTFSTSINGITHDNFDGPDLALNTWHHVGISYENKTKLLVFDGGTRTSSWNGPINTTNAAVLIGENSEATGRRWIGQLDEVRIAATARTAAWFALEYRVVADPTIVTVGAEQPY